jgi:cellobiose phosphorylase
MEKLWQFSDNQGSFQSKAANQINSLYLPLCNDALMSSITPDLHGDIKGGQNAFLLTPVSRIDLMASRSSRNFWIYVDKNKIWSATGVSKDLRQINEDKFSLDAGLLWQITTRENKSIGLRAEILSFVPASAEPVEIMQVTLTNISSKKIKFIPTAAIPMYARGANNIRDHRHVTSLLQRIDLHEFGVISCPTLAFDEAGHRPNETHYFVLGWDESFISPKYLYPAQEVFCGDSGDLEAPESILKNILPVDKNIQGREAMGALRFSSVTLPPGKSRTYTVIMGVAEDRLSINLIVSRFDSLKKARKAFIETRDFWVNRSNQVSIETADKDFDNWFRWVSIQPALRKIFGCSFLPDFDYGKGGRGWRDLWQDCLGLILSDPKPVREMLINNFSGVRIDGSNATIIGKNPGEFIADRNDIARVWMDHGVWPLLTLDLYIHETGDTDILFEEVSYFRDQHVFRSRACDKDYKASEGNKLRTVSGEVYKGSIFEHLIAQNLTQFFNVGEHNHLRLEGADWNDGLDMAKEFGESVAFSAMYAHNLKLLAELLLRAGKPDVEIAEELKILLGRIDYNDKKAKQKHLDNYFYRVKSKVCGNKIKIDSALLAKNLQEKAEWLMRHIRKSEWLKEGFFNGYYDNNKKRVEGKQAGSVRMTLTGQVFPIMAGAAEKRQINAILKSANKFLFDKKLGGYRLNTDFSRPSFKTSGGIPPKAGGQEQYNLGRAFSFVYGDKENGAFFNHMVVMYAFALYRRGFAQDGWEALSSIYKMAIDTRKSKIYPCLPEYFDGEGRGMYSYLTGSASWFVLTLLTETFGVKGKDGDLLIEPKLSPEQFKRASTISINRTFAGRKLYVSFTNRKKLGYTKYRIASATLDSKELSVRDPKRLTISRKTLLSLPPNKLIALHIELG